MTEWRAQREVRFGVVLYGGVSLAVYINGVTQELLHIVRATAQDPANPGSPLIPDAQLDGTERVYRRISQILGACEPHHDVPMDAPILTRFVVDVISGTSAGGINGVFLGKALALNQTLNDLRNLWITQGDIDTLLNDKQSVKELPLYQLQDPPQSLLNSQRMYVLLLRALKNMDVPNPPAKSPLVDELDVFATSTDLEGLIVPLQLSDRRVFERRHKAVFHFQYCDDGANSQFKAAHTPLLAFAARSTSSFPFAFQAMVQTDTDPVTKLEQTPANTEDWDQLFKDYSPDKLASVPIPQNTYPNRSFADGGYLDNKPFSFVIDQMGDRFSELPVERNLIYIEPDPEDPTAERPWTKRPDAIQNSWLALSALPRYETIRGDLERVLGRNQEVRRISDIRDFLRQQVIVNLPHVPLKAGEWETLDTVELGEKFGRAYIGYHRLKASSATDILADAVCRYINLPPDSADVQNVVSLIRAWRERAYGPWDPPHDKKSDQLNRFILHFSMDFYLRRVRHLIGTLDEILNSCEPPKGMEPSPDELECLREIRKQLSGPFRQLRDLKPHNEDFAPLGTPQQLRAWLLQAFEGTEAAGLESSAESRTREDRTRRAQEDLAQRILDPYYDNITQAAENIRKRFAVVFNQTDALILNLLTTGCGDKQVTNRLLAEFKHFEDYDVLMFPVMHNTEVKELTEIGIVRISPVDATGPVYIDAQGNAVPVVDEQAALKDGIDPLDPQNRRKLKGASLGAFGGFLEEEWRRNDMMWGRLDGAERIITTLLADPGSAAVRRQLIEQAHNAILDQELRDNPLLNSSTKPLPATPVERLLEYRRLLMPAPERESSANRIGRSLQILSKLADDLAAKADRSKLPVRVLGWAGKFTVGAAALASQRSLAGAFTVHWLRLLYLMEVVLILAGFFYGPAGRTGWTLLAFTAGIHVIVSLLRDFFLKSQLTMTFLISIAVLIFGSLAVLGGLHLPAVVQHLTDYRSDLRFLLLLPVALELLASFMIGKNVRQVPGTLPLAQLEDAKIVQDIQRVAGELGDNRRAFLRRAIWWDGWFLTSYCALFLMLAILFAISDKPLQTPDWLPVWLQINARYILAGLTAFFGFLTAVADISENARMDVLLGMSLRDLTGSTIINPQGPLPDPPAPASRAKWIFSYLTVATLGVWMWVSDERIAAFVGLAAAIVGFISLVLRPPVVRGLALLLMMLTLLFTVYLVLAGNLLGPLASRVAR